MIDETLPPERREITLALQDGLQVKVWAECYGTMCVHRSLGGSAWGVTHADTGLAAGTLTFFRKKEAAIHLARMLGDVVPPGGKLGLPSDYTPQLRALRL